jgi:hypothetical protein
MLNVDAKQMQGRRGDARPRDHITSDREGLVTRRRQQNGGKCIFSYVRYPVNAALFELPVANSASVPHF